MPADPIPPHLERMAAHGRFVNDPTQENYDACMVVYTRQRLNYTISARQFEGLVWWLKIDASKLGLHVCKPPHPD